MVKAVTPIPFVKARFFDRCGKPLAGGKVYTYEANTTTPKVTYKDPYGLTPNTNPIILDAAGEADIYLDGTYRIRITDRNDVLVNDVAKIGSWFSDNLQDSLDNVSSAMGEALKPTLQNLNDTVDAAQVEINRRMFLLDATIATAAAAGAGANGWTALLVKDASGLTQQQVNDTQKALNGEYVEKWGAKGDGVTQDSQAIQAAIDELHARWLSTNKEATLLLTADKTYVCHGITIKAGVHLACKNGKAKLLKTPAATTDTAETLKWRRVITTDSGIGIEAPNIRHRIENLIIDGNYNNLNWAFNTYDQEQGMNIILSARNGDNADTRAKFELTNVESINCTSDGICVNTNIDVMINNYKAINCFRGGLVAVGGNSIINGINLTLENASMHAEVDGPGYGDSLKADIDVTNVDINKTNQSAMWGGIVCNVQNGANQTYSNVNSYTHGLSILASDDNQDNKIVFNNCRLNWKGGSHNIPKLLQFNNCTLVSDMRGVTEVTDGFKPYWNNNYTLATNGAEVIFNGGQAYALYDDITKVGAFIKFNAGGITDDAVTKPYKMVRFLNGFKIKDFRLPYASAYGGTSVEFDNVYINTRNFLHTPSNGNIGVAGGTYIELGNVKLGTDNTQVYSSIGFADITKIVIRNTTMPLSSFVKNISNGGNYPTFWDVEGQMTLTTQSLDGIDLNNTLAFPGTRLVVTNAKNGYPCEYIACPKNMNGTKSSLYVKWVATKWLTSSFATADLPVLTAFDVGVTNFDTTTNTFKRWSGAAWI